MKVRCIYRESDCIPDNVLALGYTDQTEFNISFGETYSVYSMLLWDGVIHYLLLNNSSNRPDWYPSFIFEITDPDLPSNWYFAQGENLHGLPISALWGYSEMIFSNGKHYIGLVEREELAIQLFFARKTEMDNFVRNGDGGISDSSS